MAILEQKMGQLDMFGVAVQLKQAGKGKLQARKMKPVETPRTRQKPTSILLSPDMIAQLRVKAGKRGIGYQTLLKIILYENMGKY